MRSGFPGAEQARRKRKTRAGPQRRRKEREGRKERPTKTEPKSSENFSLRPVHKNPCKTQTKNHQNIATSNAGAHAPKSSEKRAVAQIELQKPKLRKAELFFAAFRKRKQWHFRVRTILPTTPERRSKVRSRKPPTKS